MSINDGASFLGSGSEGSGSEGSGSVGVGSGSSYAREIASWKV